MTVIYKSSEVMGKFGLKESVYKKYISSLEREGYVFQRNSQGHRIFTDEDITNLESFLELIKYDGMTIDLVARKISKTTGYDGIEEREEPKQESYEVMTLVEKMVAVALQTQEQQLKAQFQAEFQKNQEQLNRIESRANERDKLLMQSIRESQEVKKLLLEVKEQIAATKEEDKVGWWSKLFSK